MAIALDVATDGNFTSGTSHTFAHTCTGSNLVLFVHAVINDNTDTVTGVTYNGVAMTFLDKQTPNTQRYDYLYFLINPNTGSHNVVISSSVSKAIGGNAISYTGAGQSTQPDNSTKKTEQAATITTSLTTNSDNCWTLLLTDSVSQNITASTGSTLRVTNTTFSDAKFFDSNGALTPPGSKSMVVTTANSNVCSLIMVSIAPPSLNTGNFLAFL